MGKETVQETRKGNRRKAKGTEKGTVEQETNKSKRIGGWIRAGNGIYTHKSSTKDGVQQTLIPGITVLSVLGHIKEPSSKTL